MWFCSSKMELSFRIWLGGLGMLISLLILYFKAAPELEEFHKNCTLKQNWEQPFKKVKNLTLILKYKLVKYYWIFSNVY